VKIELLNASGERINGDMPHYRFQGLHIETGVEVYVSPCDTRVFMDEADYSIWMTSLRPALQGYLCPSSFDQFPNIGPGFAFLRGSSASGTRQNWADAGQLRSNRDKAVPSQSIIHHHVEQLMSK
jgi:hypothetical protein